MYASITLAEALELGVFRAAGAVVVCGQSGLHRPIRWAHLGEVFDIAPFLRGGELLLLSSHFLTSTSEYADYVDSAVGVDVAALAIELDQSLPRVPPELVSRAERHGLPVIALCRPTRFVEITEQVHSAILDRQHGFLSTADAIARELTSLLLEGADLHRVVARVSEVVGNPVIVEDAAHQVVEYGTSGRDIAWLLEAWDQHSRQSHRQPGGAGGSAIVGQCIWYPIVVRGSEWGRLHVVEVGAMLLPTTRMVIDRAASAIGLTLLGGHGTPHLRQIARNEFLSRLRLGATESVRSVVSQAAALGAYLHDHPLVAVVASADQESAVGTRDDREHVVDNDLLIEIRTALLDAGCSALAGVDGQQVVAIAGVPSSVDRATTVVDQALRRLLTSERANGAANGVIVGISDAATVDSLRTAIQRAEQAMNLANGHRGVTIVHYSDSALARLLLESSTAQLAEFVEGQLGPLLAADAQRHSDLVATLRAYLELNGNVAAAARALYIQRPSLYKRLHRIEQLLGKQLEDARTRASLYVALEGLPLLYRSGAPRRSRVRVSVG